MKHLSLATLVIALAATMPATADRSDELAKSSEALAWTVAAYASCEDRTQLQQDFKSEAAAMNAGFSDIYDALGILETAENVCDLQAEFARDMRQLAVEDSGLFEATLISSKEPAAPRFENDQPESADDTGSRFILEAASALPPTGSEGPVSESDYQQ